MNAHPIQLLLTDDLERRRVTVFFRLVLAIPLVIWFAVFSLLALVTAVVNWLATLVAGRSPSAVHNLLATYVKFTTHFYAYTHLVAEPYPSFEGGDGYPVDLRIAPPERQSRLSVLVRIPLALPALFIGTVLVGNSFSSAYGKRGGGLQFRGGLLLATAILGWFATLARGKMPRGLRDAAAYSLCYGAQMWAYVFLLTDRYPNSDPLAAVPDLPARSHPVGLDGTDDLRRSRLTVLFRIPLAFPHLVWLALWSILALLAAIANWFATLALGCPPGSLHAFLSRYVRYAVAVNAFLELIANPFPGFAGAPGSYPLDTIIPAPAPQSRLKTAFRLPLALPALILGSVYGSLASSAAFLGWFASLATGRMPRGLRNAGALGLGYQAQTLAYLLLLSDVYPYSGPCLEGEPRVLEPVATEPPSSPAQPLTDAPNPFASAS